MSPEITDNQTGDDNWRTSTGTVYNVDFTDELSGIEKIEYTVYSQIDMTGSLIIGWTDIISSTDIPSYTDDWEVNFSSLAAGTKEIAGSSATLTDAFYVKKDTSTPGITDNQTGDNTWRTAPGTTYNVDFYDYDSLLSTAYYKVSAGTGESGEIISWTPIFSGLNNSAYLTDWDVDFNNLNQGINYVTVKVRDYAGLENKAQDLFYIKKDTTSPQVTDNQEGDDIWRKAVKNNYL
jgi:hypothetical protein